MNNKGFAITGILYTLFTLFIMILLSVLATISYKKSVLEKTTVKLESIYELKKVDDISTTYQTTDTETTAQLDAKYEFITQYTTDAEITKDLVCSIYLKKGDIIPTNIPQENFTLIPNDCNSITSNIIFEGEKEAGKLLLTNVYEFKG